MESLKILVVDDEARMRKLVRDFLVKNHYEVVEAADGAEALDLFFEQNDIDLVILDVMMDEYISKPFSPKILVARVEAIFRRTGQAAAESVVEAGGIRLDKQAHSVTVAGEPVELSYKEFELLAYFMENKGIALSREKILNSVWNYDYFGDARTIDTHVKKLRSKMGEKGELIKTIWGMGYKFEEE